MNNTSLLDISKGLNIYYSMFLIAFGSVCNILSIIVLSRRTYKQTTFSIYFRYLAVVDLFTLYSGLSRHFIAAVFDYHIRDSNEIFCKIHQWTSATSPDLSAWILIVLTVERVFSIIKPMKVRSWFSRRNVCIILAFITLCLLSFNIPFLVNYGDMVVEESGVQVVQKCVMNRPEMQFFTDHIWYWIDITKFVLLPSFMLAVLNAIIVVSVTRSKKRLGKFNPGSKVNGSIEGARRPADSQKETSLTVTLIAVNLSFIILNCPISIYLIGRLYWFPEGFEPTERLVYTCCIMAMYTNNAANFLLYCATGTKFRSELRALIRYRCHHARRGHELSRPSSATRQTIATVSETV